MAKTKETDAKALYEEACKLLGALKVAEAFAVMKQAAEMGHPTAQSDLGTMYKMGIGVAKDDFEAVKWYKRAVDQDSPAGWTNLGACYIEGVGGLPKDDDKALEYIRKGAEAGYPHAQLTMARFYRIGLRNLKSDDRLAQQWLDKAIAQGYEPAIKEQKEWKKNNRTAALVVIGLVLAVGLFLWLTW